MSAGCPFLRLMGERKQRLGPPVPRAVARWHPEGTPGRAHPVSPTGGACGKCYCSFKCGPRAPVLPPLGDDAPSTKLYRLADGSLTSICFCKKRDADAFLANRCAYKNWLARSNAYQLTRDSWCDLNNRTGGEPRPGPRQPRSVRRRRKRPI